VVTHRFGIIGNLLGFIRKGTVFTLGGNLYFFL